MTIGYGLALLPSLTRRAIRVFNDHQICYEHNFRSGLSKLAKGRENLGIWFGLRVKNLCSFLFADSIQPFLNDHALSHFYVNSAQKIAKERKKSRDYTIAKRGREEKIEGKRGGQ